MTAREQRRVFDSWVAAHRGLLFKVVRAYADTSADQDDLFQEVSIALWKSIPAFRGDAAEATWIYRVALLRAMSWLRGEKRRRDVPLDAEARVLAAPAEAADERLDWIYSEIRQLDEVDRSVTLLLLDGYSYREIASTLGLSESHVGVKIHRIKKRLTGRLAMEKSHGV